MIRDVENFADFVQYYRHNYVRSRQDPEVMFLVNGPTDAVRPVRRLTMTVYRNGVYQGEEIYTEDQVWDQVQFGLPTIGMTVINGQELFYLYYRTNRSGNRGFGMNRVRAHSFNGHSLRTFGLRRFDTSKLGYADNAWTALKPTHVSLEEAWNALNEDVPGALAYALSHKFGVYLGPKDHLRLCYKMFEIGDVLSPTKIRLAERFVEYREAIRRTINSDLEIEVQ